METPACLPWSHGDPSMGCGGHDAARQRRCSRRTTRGAGDRVPLAGHRAEDHAPARSRPGEPRRPRGLAGLQPARDAPSAGLRNRHAGGAGIARWPRPRPRPKPNGCTPARPESSKISHRTSKRSSTSCATRHSCWARRATSRPTTRWSTNSVPDSPPAKSTPCSRRWLAACRVSFAKCSHARSGIRCCPSPASSAPANSAHSRWKS